MKVKWKISKKREKHVKNFFCNRVVREGKREESLVVSFQFIKVGESERGGKVRGRKVVREGIGERRRRRRWRGEGGGRWEGGGRGEVEECEDGSSAKIRLLMRSVLLEMMEKEKEQMGHCFCHCNALPYLLPKIGKVI